MKSRKVIIFIGFIFICSSLFAQAQKISTPIPGKEYYIDESGGVFMHINILGHVKYPGTYLVHESTDILTIISQSGGPLNGADLKSVILHSDDSVQVIDLKSIFKNGMQDEIFIKPNDTIIVEQRFLNLLFTRSNMLPVLLQMLNLILITK